MINFIINNTGIVGIILIFNLLLITAVIFYKSYFFYKIWPEKRKLIIKDMREGFNTGFSQEISFKILEERLETERRELEKNLGLLATISSISPLFGLLGTVLGMIESTRGILTIDNDLLLKGVSNALITTAMGLIIAIPSIIFYNFFMDKIDRYLKDLKDKIISLMER